MWHMLLESLATPDAQAWHRPAGKLGTDGGRKRILTRAYGVITCKAYIKFPPLHARERSKEKMYRVDLASLCYVVVTKVRTDVPSERSRSCAYNVHFFFYFRVS